MTDREKLIALLVQGCREERGEDDIPCCEESFCKDNHTSCYGETADYLLAHGVVVQRWIPASDPPTVTGEYIAMIRGDVHPTSLFYNFGDEKWFIFAEEDSYDVTHWMPLPEPPMRKGENG